MTHPLGPHPRPKQAPARDLRKLERFQTGARQDAVDPRIVAFASRLARSHRPDDHLAIVRELFRWVRDGIRYQPDADRVQDYSDAETILERGWGNCVTKTRLLVALLRALGYEAEFVDRWKVGPDGKPWMNHVQVRVRFPGSSSILGNVGGWLYGDLTIRGAELAQDPREIASQADTGRLPWSGELAQDD